MRVFLAGATGAIGRPLVALLRAAGHTVVGATRQADRIPLLVALGAEAVVVDLLDPAAAQRAVAAARPDVVVHQLTDLPQIADPALMAAASARNARLRAEATPLLLRAAQSAGARRAVVQSICFAYAQGPRPHQESDRFDESPERKITVDALRALEQSTLDTAGIDGLVLRYGRLYGPGTWSETRTGSSPLHVDAAAHAALQAVSQGARGIYNIAEDDGTVSIAKAIHELGFDPAFRRRAQ